MSISPSQTKLLISRPLGPQVATLRLVERTAGSLLVLSDDEAASRGEEPVQLVEGHSYEFELDVNPVTSYRLRESPAIQPSRISPYLGRVEPGLATGLLPIILESADGLEVGRTHVEVRTNKIDYHHDYRLMLDLIAERSIALLLDIHAPAQVRLTPDLENDIPRLHESFAFLRHLLTSREFREAMDLIIATPHHRTATEITPVKLRQDSRSSRSLMSSIARGRQRVEVPPLHPVTKSMRDLGVEVPSLPMWVAISRSQDSRDTTENRFIKHALIEFFSVLLDIEALLSVSGTPTDVRLLREVVPLKRSLAEYLEASLFKEVGAATILPLGSAVLQRRNGYREILSVWLKFSVAARLTWQGGEDVFGAGKKDVALLYEYWLFFILVDVISEVFQLQDLPLTSLVEWTSSGFDMKLRAGSAFSITTTYRKGQQALRIRFSYNRTFTGVTPSPAGSYPKPGSWTRSMRPDYSLSLWPDGFTEDQAEREELISHIHFDAKYRVESIAGLFGIDNESELEEEDQSQRANTRPKRSDLLKMHAYRDAIRRTQGAYVLYPGSADVAWIEFHEILPGLGAFSVRPGMEQRAKQTLSRFLRDVLAHRLEVHTQHERRQSH